MDKSCNSSGASGDSSAVSASASASATSSTGNNNTGNRDHYLRQLNKLSHKISKPTANSSAVNREIDHQSLPPPPLPPINQGNLHQHQPPVYNINKNDFRDVVQKLTGSPAHERISAPPQQPIHQPKPQQSSRLHRIRPPPLAHVINRPPSLLNDALIPPGAHHHHHNWTGGYVPRPTAPLSPLPPLPPVHAAAESPVSSYMRYLQNSMFQIDSNRKEFSGLSPLAPLVSPRWFQQQQENAPPPQNNGLPPQPPAATGTVSQAAPTSIPAPPPFGRLNSPKSPYGLLSPSILLSPTSGQLGFPVSPTTVPLSSPKYKGH
uniref:VQ domain-containing protein n=1 Tax=Noccaea caerulescens TaxID=107243 RepID=A0A1J3EJH9_NOCCA